MLHKILFLDDANGEITAEACEAVAGDRADDDADNDVSEVVLAYEDATDSYHEGPEEHPISICLKPLRHIARLAK